MMDRDYWLSELARLEALARSDTNRMILRLSIAASLAQGPWIIAKKPRVDSAVREARRQAHLTRMLAPKFDRSLYLRKASEAEHRRQKTIDREIEIEINLEYSSG